MSLIIPDSPYTSKSFTREEKVIIMSRKRDDYHAVEKRQLKWDQVSHLSTPDIALKYLPKPLGQRIRPRHQDLALLPSWTHRQHPERWYQQLRVSTAATPLDALLTPCRTLMTKGFGV
jgi:hypothetical protein